MVIRKILGLKQNENERGKTNYTCKYKTLRYIEEREDDTNYGNPVRIKPDRFTKRIFHRLYKHPKIQVRWFKKESLRNEAYKRRYLRHNHLWEKD